MRVNLPCLMGSCPNFLRPTCSYTECLPSFLAGSCPMKWPTESYSLFVVWFLLTLWFYKVRFPTDAYPASLNRSFCYDPRSMDLGQVNRFLSRLPLNFKSFWTSAGFWNTAFLLLLIQPGFPTWIPAGCLLTSSCDHTWFLALKS